MLTKYYHFQILKKYPQHTAYLISKSFYIININMKKDSYFEGWGYTDTIKLIFQGSKADSNALFKELKATFPTDEIFKVGDTVLEVFVSEQEIPTYKKIATVFKMKTKIVYMNGGKTEEIYIAKVILDQLGGQARLVVMTGAYNFIALKNGVAFKLKSRKANFVKITLNSKDLYDVEFIKLIGLKPKKIAEYNDVYFDQLIPIVEKETGMYLKLFKKGGFVSTQNRDMVLSQLKAIHHHEEELRSALKTSPEIEAWVLAKVQRATVDLSDVTHYLDGKTEYEQGGEIYIEMSFSRLKNEFKNEPEIFNGEIVKRGQNHVKLIKDILYIKTPNKNWEIFRKIKYDKGGKTEYGTGGTTQKTARKLQKSDAIIYKDETWYITEKNGVVGIISYSRGAWGDDYPFIPLSKVDLSIVTDMYGNSVQFAEGGVAKRLSVADANPYIATAKAVQGIAPHSVSALDQKIAKKLNPDPNRPIFFKNGGEIYSHKHSRNWGEDIKIELIEETKKRLESFTNDCKR
jgi:hypothetical protein